jgi:hypothetical protein
MIANLEAKLQDKQFREDVNGLIVSNDLRFNPQSAMLLITDRLLFKI